MITRAPIWIKGRLRRGPDTALYLLQVRELGSGRARCLHRTVNFGAWNLVFLWSMVFGAWSLSAAPALTDLQCYPTNVALFSAKSTQRLVIQATYADGITRDVTSDASFKLTNPKILRRDQANLSPLADGQTELRV